MIELQVQNMTCGGCAASVTRAVKSLDPAAKVTVDLGKAHVSIEGSRDAAEYGRVLAEAGYPAMVPAAKAAAPRSRGCCCG